MGWREVLCVGETARLPRQLILPWQNSADYFRRTVQGTEQDADLQIG